ncbi:MAG: peptidoglycan DD-metalloendopeptidase family protein [Candidatus Aenigmarchaeota archaeon]|nr:peptidoglycan DD-metalloendopeptidase family protein [Candidatus Aenigmarchaeota archaeon]
MNLTEILKRNREQIGRIFNLQNAQKFFIFDFSASNKELQTMDMENALQADQYVKNILRENSADVGIGKYAEDRVIYKHSPLFGTARTIHLGIDIFLPAGTKVFSPLPATVHSFQNNRGIGDYGPTIILQHDLEGILFFTLYGHLSLESLEGKTVGQKIAQGEIIGKIGTLDINGNWPEHVHFQIIADMLGKKGDFPGVCSRQDREFYLNNCPDPNLILKLQI